MRQKGARKSESPAARPAPTALEGGDARSWRRAGTRPGASETTAPRPSRARVRGQARRPLSQESCSVTRRVSTAARIRPTGCEYGVFVCGQSWARSSPYESGVWRRQPRCGDASSPIVCGGVRAGTAFARDPEPIVGHGAVRVDDRVIALEQLGAGDVLAEADATEEAKAGMPRGPLVHARDRLDLRVVGRDAEAHQPERRLQRVIHIDLELGLQKLIGGVEARRARADVAARFMSSPPGIAPAGTRSRHRRAAWSPCRAVRRGCHRRCWLDLLR